MSAQIRSDAHRDPRLDFFRGLGMFIILIAHIPWNTWHHWIPARFGYSDASEIFVFCSGAASAIAFFKVFETRGWPMGAARVAFRIWQIYWCHLGVFLAAILTVIALDHWIGTGGYYLASLGIPPLTRHGDAQIVGLMTLTYVPGLFDILPMYMVILALMPVIAALAIESRTAAIVFSVALYLAGSQPWIIFNKVSSPTLRYLFVENGYQLFRFFLSIALILAVIGVVCALARFAGRALTGVWRLALAVMLALALIALWSQVDLFAEMRNLNLRGSPWDDKRTWFFNPFTWQLLFFTGFAFSAGWLPAPPIDRRLMWAAAAILLISFPLDPDGVLLRELRDHVRSLRAAPADPQTIQWYADLIRSLLWTYDGLAAITSKTYFGVFRYIHFLALAYLVWALAGDRGANLPQTGWAERAVTVVRRVGQQSLAVFVASLVIAQALGVWIRETAVGPAARTSIAQAFSRGAFSPDYWNVMLANLTGCVLIIGVAYAARFFRRQPWRDKAASALAASASGGQSRRSTAGRA
ncbi:MAG: OpgC domain-containing protein [Neomegalonema sp.]|nr:OpgC domain-containing protein [Neomegalonema sp.]